MEACIWLIGGTSESAQLARLLTEKGLPYVVTVTTTAAQQLYPDETQVWVGRLTSQLVLEFVKKWQVRCILDASHPFASEISRIAIICGQSKSIAYLRYERPTVAGSCLNVTDAERESTVILVKSISDLLESGILRGQRVLLTLGYRHLSLFSGLRPDSQLFARILPSVEAISGATAAGFSASEIIAFRPPVSAALESALWQQWNITQVVAKASGKAGGEAVKRAIAAELSIPLILIERPQITYPNRTISCSEAIEFCIKTLKVY